MADHDPSCRLCGSGLDPAQLDVRVLLPDVLLDAPREEWGREPLLEVYGFGAFVRCLLPVHLSGGMLLTFGTWLSVHPDDLRHAREVWRTADYPSLELDGTLANAIQPWGQAILDAPVRVAVRKADEIPYVVASPHATLGRVIADEWDRDTVLGSLATALPVPIQARVSDDWSVERGAGFTVRLHEESLRFVGPGRTVILDIFGTDRAQTVDEVLATMIEGAPAADGRLTERDGGELRHARWMVAGAQHELYGLVIRPGSMLSVTCVHDDPADHEWALHTWRSVRFHGEV
ncbi:DUF2199 domain-containing protein [Dactylosporangium sp. NPDC005555]|uniref:DUF2199 domain-containing protein n=1 Tax=Dactylosporangium sp. NPDC005555 TaxID=3154889 RepID=UPI00339FFCDB